jgi:hypothetical protein
MIIAAMVVEAVNDMEAVHVLIICPTNMVISRGWANDADVV